MIRSTSVTGSAKPARCSSAPISRTSAKGATRRRGAALDLRLSRSECTLAQLGRGIAAERAPQKKQAVGLQRAADLDQRARQIVDELQRQRRHHEIERAVGETAAPPRRRRRVKERYGQVRAAVAGGSAATMIPTLPLAASTRRTASVGVPRSTARSNGRSTADSRSPSSSATRSIRKVSGPKRPRALLACAQQPAVEDGRTR